MKIKDNMPESDVCFELLKEIEKEKIEKLKEVDIYAEWLQYGVYLVKEEDGRVYLLDNGIKSNKPLSLDPNGFCYMLPYNSSRFRWYNIKRANEEFKKANIIQIKCRNGILPIATNGYDGTSMYELGDYVLIVDIYKRPKKD